MKKLTFLFITVILCYVDLFASDVLPVRGFCIATPESKHLDRFIKFIDEELASRKVNTLVLRIDYRYEFERHPELRDHGFLTKQELQRIVAVCQKHQIRIIPQVNLLGHQSWAESTGKLLQVYPQFDETPGVRMPDKHEWPNADSLYCKSYCPLHPDLHNIIFNLIDEICDACDADAFHAGMDEVFYIGHKDCPRCAGHDKAELYANEVNLLRGHLKKKKRQLWIWGDRLIDGNATGIGLWEGSANNTHRAIDLISKDIVICDWHYERAEPTATLFALKGFNVVTCPWQKPELAVVQTQDMFRLRKNSNHQLRNRYQGMMQTIWSGADAFLDEFYSNSAPADESQAACFKVLFDAINVTNTTISH